MVQVVIVPLAQQCSARRFDADVAQRAECSGCRGDIPDGRIAKGRDEIRYVAVWSVADDHQLAVGPRLPAVTVDRELRKYEVAARDHQTADERRRCGQCRLCAYER